MSELKKIVVIGPCYPYRGGIATFVAHLCKLLNTKYEVHLINYAMLYPSILFPGKTQYDESKDLVFSFSNERLFSSLNPFSWYRTAKRVQALQPDIIIMDWWNPFFGLCFRGFHFFLNRALRKRILVVTENVVSHEGRYIDTALTKLGVTIGQAYIVLSEKVREQIQYFGKGKPTYKSNLPIYDQFDVHHKVFTRTELVPKFSKDDYVMLCFGYVRKYKGVDIAIAAMPYVLQQIPNAKLLIVGECYDEWAEYEKQIAALGLQNHVHSITNYVPNEDVEQYFAISDVVLLPYRTATQSGILNIAYGFKKTVVATNVGGFVEFIEHGKTGVIVNKVDEKVLADGILTHYQTMHGKDHKEAITQLIQRNSFENILDHVESFWQQVKD
ncbi:MAG: hypothetical protein RL660_151 [Bacteroidota bacterium]|jgi:glycosyltransferase involved in cell wall biosynthesis